MLSNILIGYGIKEARIKCKMSQARLANIFGITIQAISKWEKGSSMPDITTFYVLSVILKFDIYELMRNDELSDVKNKVNGFKYRRRIQNIRLVKKNLKRSEYVDTLMTLVHLDGVDLSSSTATNTVFYKTILANCNLSHVVAKNLSFFDVIFSGCNLDGADFSNSSYSNVVFKRNIANCTCENSTFYNSSFDGEIMDHLKADGTKYVNCSFTKIFILGATFNAITFEGCTFYDVELKSCNVKNFIFKNCKFVNSKMIKCQIDEKSRQTLVHTKGVKIVN